VRASIFTAPRGGTWSAVQVRRILKSVLRPSSRGASLSDRPSQCVMNAQIPTVRALKFSSFAPKD